MELSLLHVLGTQPKPGLWFPAGPVGFMGAERGAVARPLVQTGTVRGPHGDFLVEGRIVLGSQVTECACFFLHLSFPPLAAMLETQKDVKGDRPQRGIFRSFCASHLPVSLKSISCPFSAHFYIADGQLLQTTIPSVLCFWLGSANGSFQWEVGRLADDGRGKGHSPIFQTLS